MEMASTIYLYTSTLACIGHVNALSDAKVPEGKSHEITNFFCYQIDAEQGSPAEETTSTAVPFTYSSSFS
jgi:hypothetical protein